jgi:hypothetical protein
MMNSIALNIQYKSPDEDDKNGGDSNPDGGDKGGGS